MPTPAPSQYGIPDSPSVIKAILLHHVLTAPDLDYRMSAATFTSTTVLLGDWGQSTESLSTRVPRLLREGVIGLTRLPRIKQVRLIGPMIDSLPTPAPAVGAAHPSR